ncbi:hypothetical protein [Bradyrhizobium mercantei]|uniref:hypothetical protein n=1 Tax=Bradyrhizobium mercantei TaxID=1904807 RepID=UPI000977490B|nr:hypothetical protein [Bradyrhizobium mercantei]
MQTDTINGSIGFDALRQRLSATKPNQLLIFMALAEQCESVADIAGQVQALPASIRPHVIVGGYAVKTGLAPPVTGADFVADISSLNFG